MKKKHCLHPQTFKKTHWRKWKGNKRGKKKYQLKKNKIKETSPDFRIDLLFRRRLNADSLSPAPDFLFSKNRLSSISCLSVVLCSSRSGVYIVSDDGDVT
jgi:hypothetical protein